MEKKNDKARVGLICSILGLLGPLAIVGLIFSILGLKESKNLDGKGKTQSIIGIVIGSFFLIIMIAAVAYTSDETSENPSSNNEDTQIEEKSTNETTNDNKKTTKKKTKSKEKFSYTIEKQYSSMYSYYIEGTVTNNKDKDYSYVSIKFVCYDAEGNNKGTALGNTTNLLGKQTWKYKALLIDTNNEVDHCDFFEVSGF